MTLNVIGISAFYHDAACCLLRDGELLAAAEEERFSRLKHERRGPPLARLQVLPRSGGIAIDRA